MPKLEFPVFGRPISDLVKAYIDIGSWRPNSLVWGRNFLIAITNLSLFRFSLIAELRGLPPLDFTKDAVTSESAGVCQNSRLFLLWLTWIFRLTLSSRFPGQPWKDSRPLLNLATSLSLQHLDEI